MTDCLLVGDVHLTDDAKRPQSRKPGYTEQILDKLRFCVDEANQRSIPLVQAGDVFNLKASSKNSHRLVQQVHEVLKEVNNGVFIVPGNHDLSGDRLDSLEFQPLGALCRMTNVNLLIGETDDLPGIAGVPYITEFDGGSWQHALRDKWEYFGIEAEEQPSLLVTHAPIFPPGQEPGVYYSILPDVWAESWAGVSSTYYGHIHENHGVFTSPNGLMQFCNHGSLSRGSLHTETINHKPACTLWSGGEFTRIEVPHKTPEEVFLFDEAERKAVNKASAAGFTEALNNARLTHLTAESLHASLQAQVTDSEVRHLIEQVLEEVL